VVTSIDDAHQSTRGGNILVDSNVSQHYRSNELPFLESIDSLSAKVANEYRPILTNFLNPRQLYILETIVNRYEGVSFQTFGGFASAEMKRAVAFPDYFTPGTDDYNITTFQIDYPSKFATLSHGQILGSIMGSGIDRDVIGDIVTDGFNWQFMCESEMADYVQDQVDRIGKIKVKLKRIGPEQIIIPVDEGEELTTTVASLRVDALVSEGFHISRHHAKELVEGGMIKVNWEDANRPDLETSIQDIISVRGFGRISITDIAGTTKKGKIRIGIKVYNRNK
jgi:RNA-binding protein YlmH